MTPLFILIGILAVLVLWLIGSYNSLVTLRNRVREALSDIDVQFKRRYDLIPNLINTVKGAANFESSTLEKVIAARNSAMGTPSTDITHKGEVENQLTGALKSIFALSESYPDLKASANFLELQRELTDTEDKIQSSRRFYNNAVLDLNTKIETFPSLLVARLFAFVQAEFFTLDEKEAASAAQPVAVQF